MAKEHLTRLEYLIGEDKIEALSQKHILIAGVGGVGGFVAEAMCRSGIGNITIVDFDKVDVSNLNRQLMAQKDNIGQDKVDVLKSRIELISDTKVTIKKCFIDESFQLDEDYDYVIDCIDTLTSKFELVKKCHEKNIPVISSMGTAKRLEIKNIKYTTLDKTENDPLAKAFRNLVKKNNYHHKIEVVYLDYSPIKSSIINEEGNTNKERYPLGSAIFTVGSVGLYIASIVFQKLLEENQ